MDINKDTSKIESPKEITKLKEKLKETNPEKNKKMPEAKPYLSSCLFDWVSHLVMFAFVCLCSSIALKYISKKDKDLLKSNPFDVDSYSNFDKIQQKHIDLNLFLNFDSKSLNGSAIFIFEVLDENEKKIILDNFYVNIKEITLLNENNKNINKKLNFLIYDKNEDKEALGTPVIIELNKTYKKNTKLLIKIVFTTSEKSQGIQFLSSEQTSSKKYPFMFTQSEAILSRSLFPCQDTPSAKVTVKVKASVISPLVFLFSGLPLANYTQNNLNIFEYEQKIPVPTYLIAFAAGELEYAQISKRCGVWTEKGISKKAVYEFGLCEKYILTAEKYLNSQYLWGVYNILVLPFSFPYGGMENPSLTFVTPALLAGDRSLTNVITHEISHSWTGNLVTNKNWGNFWVNEGFTTFLERKICEKIYGKNYAKLLSYVGKYEMNNEIKIFGETHEFTKLSPNYEHTNPDDGFSTIPYEKGFHLLYYLESELGEENFAKVLSVYIQKYQYQSVDYTAFKGVVESFIKEKKLNIIIDWEKWLYTPGKPIKEFDFSNHLVNEGLNMAKTYLKNEFDKTNHNKDYEIFKEWDTSVKLIYLNYILNNSKDKKLEEDIYKAIRDNLKLNENKYNAEVKYIWFQICLQNKDNSCIPYVKEFLRTHGRMKYLKPVYLEWKKLNKNEAKNFFEENKNIYHDVAKGMLENLFSN